MTIDEALVIYKACKKDGNVRQINCKSCPLDKKVMPEYSVCGYLVDAEWTLSKSC